MQQETSARLRNGWLAAGCVLALICLCRSAVAQATSSAEASPAKKTGETRTANPKKHVKAASGASAANTTTAPRKAHAASHPPAGTHPKSNAAAASRDSKSKTSSKSAKRRRSARGQQKIDSERAQSIQEALIREHYLSSQPTGTWNQASEDAMRKYQADHGWQSKTVPDSRALISLGLGPSHDHLLNPESAMTTEPSAPRAAALTPASHSADPGARMNANPAPAATPGASRPQ